MDLSNCRACLALVLVSVAIQGVTPDPHDLASPRTWQLLYAFLADQQLGADATSPDEVCDPYQPGPLLTRWVTAGQSRSGAPATGARAARTAAGRRPSRSAGADR